jgi:hypothetical protein
VRASRNQKYFRQKLGKNKNPDSPDKGAQATEHLSKNQKAIRQNTGDTAWGWIYRILPPTFGIYGLPPGTHPFRLGSHTPDLAQPFSHFSLVGA